MTTPVTIGDDQPAPTRSDAVGFRLAFDVAIDQLTQPGQAHVQRDDGSSTTVTLACLADELTAALEPGMENTGGHGGGSTPPAALNALTLLADIHGELRPALAALGEPPADTLRGQLRQWARHAEHWQHVDPQYLGYAAGRAEHWVECARAVLDPPPRYPLRYPCPACRARWVLVWSAEENDEVRRDALTVDPDRLEAVCGACQSTWPLDLPVLAQAAIDQNHHHETLTHPTATIFGNTPGESIDTVISEQAY